MRKILGVSLIFGLVILAGILITYSPKALAGEIHIPADHDTIQAGINAASNGDVIVVYPGTYYENINFLGKDIILRSTNPFNKHVVATTIINGGKAGRVLMFNNKEGEDSVLVGFTICNGAAYSGGGIYCHSSSPRIMNCTIIGNYAENGGGIYCYSSSPSITNCTISENYAYSGGGIDLISSSLSITNCIISGNSAYNGGGIYCSSSSPSITNCTISGNSANWGGGIWCGYSSSPTIINCILWGDLPEEISGGTPPVIYSDIQQESDTYSGTGNINIDPLFVKSKQGNYYLKGGSPCIGTGTSGNAPLKDKEGIVRGAEIDMGAYEYVDAASCTPRASFTVDQNIGNDPLRVEFDASSSGGSQYSGATFSWDFGDGSTGSGLTVSHTYLSYGSYDVTLAITSGCGSHSLTLIGLIKVLSSEVTKEVGEGYAYSSIQKAIDDSDCGEYILVHDGTYNENIHFLGNVIIVRSENGADRTIIDGNKDGAVVIFHHHSDSVLDGFTIQNGSAEYGSGISCNSSSPSITNCIISRNGDYNEYYKRYEGEGGGICYYYSSPTISNCTISGNSAEYGGGIYCSYSSGEIVNCIFTGNSVYYHGGGIHCESSSISIANCTISENSARLYGGGVHCASSSSLSITNCAISGNSGGLYGGGIYCASPLCSITNCTIIGNSASGYSLFLAGYRGSGGGIYCSSSSLGITNCTISGNFAEEDGGGIYCFYSSSPSIKNCILWGDLPEEISGGGTPIVTHSDIQRYYGTYPGTGNINADPFFVKSEQGNYYLKCGSPCVGLGTPVDAPLEDKEGIVRGPEIDMGAYEYVDTTSCTPRASFTVNQNKGNDFLRVEFDALSSGGSQYTGATFLWNFGDGSTGSGLTTSHIYINYGPHDVTLTITTDCGSHSLTLFDLIKVLSSEPTMEVGEGYDYSTIQAAIDDSDYGDYILVHDGTYNEYIEFKKKVITVRSENGSNSTIIGENYGPIVSFYHYSDSVLDGFTIQNGSAEHGGGIFCSSSSASIMNCSINRNVAEKYGAGIYCFYSSASIINCNISNNASMEYGGGIYCFESSVSITNSTISDNSALSWGGGIYCRFSSLNITNCILWANSPEEISGNYTPTISYSDIQQESGICPGTGNINLDPLFVRNDQGNYYLKGDSPCIGAGASINAPLEDKEGIVRGSGIDMGAYEFVDSTSSTPRASFTVNKNMGNDPLTVEFDASSSGGGQFSGATFSWDFGDDSIGSGLTVSHTYLSHGSYDVTLTISTDCGSHSLTLLDLIKAMSSKVTKEVGEGYDYSSIQEAINDSDCGEYILVHDGIYNENIELYRKVIRVCSENGASSTIITGKMDESVVSFYPHSDSILDGFTIQDGSASHGGGIYCFSSSPSIMNCIISNSSASHGGGIYCHSSSPRITECTISWNSAENSGGGIYCFEASPRIIHCHVNDNKAPSGGGLFCESAASPLVADCVFIENIAIQSGGGIFYCQDHISTIIDSLFLYNKLENGITSGISLKNNKITCSDNQLLKYHLKHTGIQGYKEGVGKWESGYKFFGRPCGRLFQSENSAILFISNLL